MGGNATFSGTRHQSGIIAFIEVHILARRPLRWLGLALDTPTAVLGETKGLGDDARVEIENTTLPIEVEAKHGMRGGAELDEVVDRLRPGGAFEPEVPLVLAIDRTSTRTIQTPLRNDLARLRSGRSDGLRAEAKRLVGRLGDEASVLSRLHVALADVDTVGDAEAKIALQILGDAVLDDPDQAEAAWSALLADAETVSANGERRDAASLELLLQRHGIALKPSSAERFWSQQLDFVRELIEQGHAEVALETLLKLETRLDSPPAGPKERQRLVTQMAACLLRLERWQEALTTARRALDIEETVPALSVVALASYYLGDIAETAKRAQRAIELDPSVVDGWMAMALVATAKGEPLLTPPASVEQSPRYQLGLAQLAAMSGDWADVWTATSNALTSGERNPEVLLLRADALLLSDSAGLERGDARLAEVIDLATEVIDHTGRRQLVGRALTTRGEAHQRLGQADEARGDVERAQAMDPTDRTATYVAAEQALISGRFDDAAALLNALPVDVDPIFLTLQAELAVARRNPEEAQAKIDAAIGRLHEAHRQDAVLVKASMVAADLGNIELATDLLGQLDSEHIDETQALVARARLAILRREFDVGTDLFKRAASREPQRATDLLYELARLLYRAEEPGLAADVLIEIPANDQPENSRHLMARSLLEAGRFAAAQQVVDALDKKEPLPVWALEISANIALRADDMPRAISHLKALADSAPRSASVRLQLARILIGEGQTEAARDHLDTVTVDGLRPMEILMLADLRSSLGQTAEAWELGFRAFRESPNDPDVERAVAGLVFPPRQGDADGPDVVSANTYVEMRSRKGETEAFFVCAVGPFDAWRREISLEEAADRGLLGMRIGDVIVRDKGDWREEHWTIERIVPGIFQVAFEIVSTFNKRRPDEPYVGEKFTVSDELSGLDLVPLIGMAGDRRRGVQAVLDQYRRNLLPLGFIANRVGLSVPQLMTSCRASPEETGPLIVEWPGASDQRRATQIASAAQEVVVTRSALDTAQRLGLLHLVLADRRVFSPQSLLVELKREAAEAGERVRNGVTTMMTDAQSGIRVHEVPAGDPSLVAEHEAIAATLNWLTTDAQIASRPLEMLGRDEEDARRMLGPSSYDALELAAARSLPIYADDLGLRRFELFGVQADGFSTVTFLLSTVESGRLGPQERDDHLLRLALENYAHIRPTTEIILGAIARNPALTRDELRRIFALLAQPGWTLAEVASIAVGVIKQETTGPFQRMPARVLTELALEGMQRMWPVTTAAAALLTRASGQLALVPQHLESVESAARDFVKRSLGGG